MGERNIWKKHISFPQVQEHLYTGGEEEEEEGGKPSKNTISSRKTRYKKHFQKQDTLDIWHPVWDGFVYACSYSMKYLV